MIETFRKFLRCDDAVFIDLHILSLYRLNGQEQSSLPGLMVFAPPRKAARGREREPLLVSLLLNGNSPFSNTEYEKLASDAAAVFHGTHGALTSALRAAAESINRTLLERNLSTTSRGQYVIGWLTLAVLRDTQLTILQCGPTHVLMLNAGASRHLYDPVLSGKGLGLSQSVSQFFSQAQLQPGDRLLLCPNLPPSWENALTSDHGLPAPEAARRRLLTLAEGDVSGVLIHVMQGTGNMHLAMGGTPPPPPQPVADSPTVDESPAFVPPPPTDEEPPPVHLVGRPPLNDPSAYAIPPQPPQDDEALVEQLASAAMNYQYPPSIPRSKPPEPDMEAIPETMEDEPDIEQAETVAAPRRSPEEIVLKRAEGRRQAARVAVNGIQAWRNMIEQVGTRLRKFLPNLLPGGESDISLPVPAMAFISILIPVLMATIGFIVFMHFGAGSQYDSYLASAQIARQQALAETDPVLQKEAWNTVLQRVTQAESYKVTSDTSSIRGDAQSHLDVLLGVSRLDFIRLFASGLNADISRMAVSDTDLYMLDAVQGSILHASVNGNVYRLEDLDCKPGAYGNITVGPLVDLLVLPKANTLNSTVLGVDAAGNLLYCAPGQVPRPMSLTPPSTNWGRVTGMTLDSGKLYVLDASARAVWIYTAQDGVFTDAPLFFFGNQIPDIQDAIDIAVSGDDLYLLHADGRLTYCMYSRIEDSPTRCDSPVKLTNPSFPAYGNTNAFEQAHFTQMALTGPPDSTLLLLDADGQSVYRLSSRGFELQGILTGTFPAGPLGAMTSSANHTLYLAHGNQVYVTNDAP